MTRKPLSVHSPPPGPAVRRLVVLGLAVLTSITVVRAQAMDVDATFAPLLIDELAGATHTTLLPLARGGLVAYGSFTYVDGLSVAGVARLDATGRYDPTFVFDGAAPDAGGLVELIDGRFLVVRTTYDSGTGLQTTTISRHLAGGSRDGSFTPIELSNGYVWAIDVAPDGRVLIGGYFSTFAGAPRDGLARLNADGTLDASFAPTLLGPTTVVLSLAVEDAGSVIVSAYSTAPTIFASLLGRFRADGSRDPEFAPATDPTPYALPPGVLAALPGKRVLITGTPATRLNADGSIDASFAPELPVNHRIVDAVPFADGRLLVGAQAFGNTQPSPLPTPLPTKEILLLGTDDHVLVAYRDALPPGHSLHLEAMTAATDLIVLHGLPAPNPFIIVAAQERNPQPESVASLAPSLSIARISRVRLDGTLDPTFAPALGVAGTIARLAVGPSASLLISGDFTRVNGEARPGLARLRVDGSLDPGFAVPASLGQCQLALTEADGAMLVQSEAGLHRLRMDGTIADTLSPGSDLAAPEVRLHAIDDAGRILASQPGSGQGEYVLSRFDAAGRRLTETPVVFHTFGSIIFRHEQTPVANPSFVGNGAFNPINQVQPLPDGGLLVQGSFWLLGAPQRTGVVRLSADGVVDPNYIAQLPNPDSVAAFGLQSGGRALVHTVDSVHGFWRNETRRLLTDGSLDPTFRTRPAQYVEGILELTDGTLLTLPSYGTVDRLSSDGVPDPNFHVTFDQSPGFYGTTFEALSTSSGAMYLGGRFAGVNGVARTGLARLVPHYLDGITVQPATTTTVIAGDTFAFEVAVGNAGNVSYQWQKNGSDLPGETRALLVRDFTSGADAGSYRVRIVAGGVTYLSNPAMLTVTPSDARLVNFSARSRVRPGGLPQIAGFVLLGGSAPHPVLLRAIELNFSNAFAQQVVPRLGLFAGPTEIAWDQGSARTSDILTLGRRLGAFDPPLWQPVPGVFLNQDSALALDISNGIHTAQTTATSIGNGGVCLFEFYDAAEESSSVIVRNASLRGHTAPGADTMIAGFAIAGSGPQRVLLRAIGPELATWGVADALADPQLTLYQHWTPIATNNDWNNQDAVAVAAVVEATSTTGAFPLASDSPSAALFVSLAPGVYTGHATANTAGEVLLEIYVVEE